MVEIMPQSTSILHAIGFHCSEDGAIYSDSDVESQLTSPSIINADQNEVTITESACKLDSGNAHRVNQCSSRYLLHARYRGSDSRRRRHDIEKHSCRHVERYIGQRRHSAPLHTIQVPQKNRRLSGNPTRIIN